MPNSIATRARGLQQRYPFYTPADCRLLAEMEAEEAKKTKA